MITNKKEMIVFLSCGPILEPLIGMAIALLVCGFLFVYIVKQIRSSDFYRNDFKVLSHLNKLGVIALLLTVVVISLWLVFFILTMIFTGILLAFTK